jgi:hypothetical protein
MSTPQHRMILTSSLLLAIWLTFVYYPGVMLSDTYHRWELVQNMIQTGGSNKFAIIPALWMAFTYWLTQNYALFTLLQSFFFFYSSFHIIRIAGNLTGIWLGMPIALFALFPLFQGYSIFQENSVGTVIGINFTLILLAQKEEQRSEIQEVFYFLGCFLVFSALFGFRQNNITMLPVVAFMLYQTRQSKANNTRIQTWAVATALVVIFCLPHMLEKYRNIRILHEVNFALSWETAQIIKRTKDSRYEHYLDYLGNSPDATKNALRTVEKGILGHLVAPDALVAQKIIEPSITGRLIKDYLKVIVAHPKEFLQTRLYSWSRILGVSGSLHFWGFHKNKDQKLANYGWRPTKLRDNHISQIYDLINHVRFLLKPYILFLVAGIAVVVGKRCFKDMAWVGPLYLFAVTYYGGFFLINQSYEFRYYFPAFYLLSVICLIVLTKVLEQLYSYRMQKKYA